MRALLLLPILPLLIAARGGEAGPEGLAYRCGDQVARIAFNGQGYVPGVTTREPYLGAADAVRQRPRATATLNWAGHEYPMYAEWTYEGLRYRASEPYEGNILTFASTGETAILARAPRGEGTEPEQIASCTRARTVEEATAGSAPAAPEAHSEGSAGH